MQQTMTGQPQYEVSDQDKARQKTIAAAWQAYDGDLEPPLIPMPNEPDDNVVGNYIEDKVDAGVAFLFGKEVEIAVDETAPQEAQDFLNDAWGEKETRIPRLQGLAYNGAMAGQAFLRIVPNEDDTYRLIEEDPAIIFVQTAPQDCETVLLYCIEYCVTEKTNGNPVQVFYHEEITRIDPQNDDPDSEETMQDQDTTWQIAHWTRIGDRGPWTPVGEPYPWPYPFAPIFSNQNLKRPNCFWGKPDVTKNLIGLNKALNLGDSNINRILKLYAAPLLYATGVGESSIDVMPGRIHGLPTTDSTMGAVTLSTDVANSLEFAKRLEGRIDQQTGVPGIATGRQEAMSRGQMSGIAIELAFMSLTKRTDAKRCLYGKLIIDVSRALLMMAGFSPDIKVSLKWQNPLPNDDIGSFQAAVLAQQIGVSDETLLEERGYDAQEEQERSADEAAQKMVNFSRGQAMPPQMMQDSTGQQQQQPAQEPQFLGRA